MASVPRATDSVADLVMLLARAYGSDNANDLMTWNPGAVEFISGIQMAKGCNQLTGRS